MSRLSAYESGSFNPNSLRLRTKADNSFTLQLNVETEPLDIQYSIDTLPQLTKTLSGGGIVRIDEESCELTYTINIPESDNLNRGVLNHYIAITTDDGFFKMTLDKGRVRVEG